MENREAIECLKKEVACEAADDLKCIGTNCLKCEHFVSPSRLIEAYEPAISALEFRERYDRFWEEVKSAGKAGKEVEIHHSGRVFRIREVAQ